MKIIRNEKLIARNEKISRYVNLAALVSLGIGIYIAFTRPELLTWSLIAMFVGFVLTQVSIFLGNRYSRKPRPDEVLDAALKGIPGEYTLYHYCTPVPHVLNGPAGIWVLVPYHQKGRVIFEKNRWRNFGGGFAQGYMRIFGQEGIGRPDLEADSQINALEKFFRKKLGEEAAGIPPINAALVFLSPDIEIEAEGAPIPTLQAKKLKDHLRKHAKENPLPPELQDRIQSAILG